MIHPENLKAGEFVAVTGLLGRHLEWANGEGHPPASFNGRPLEVLAVSVPFVSVWDGRRQTSVDMRDLILTRVSRKYAMTFYQDQNDGRFQRRTGGGKGRPVQEAADPRVCQRCGARFVQRLAKTAVGVTFWQTVCPECGNSGPESVRT